MESEDQIPTVGRSYSRTKPKFVVATRHRQGNVVGDGEAGVFQTCTVHCTTHGHRVTGAINLALVMFLDD